jgi:hypothetical protein
VVGEAQSGFNAGVYHFGDNYQIMYYPLDYSSAGTLYMTMQGNYGIPATSFFGQTNQLGRLELDGTGGMAMTSHGTNILFSSYLQNQCSIWFAPNNPLCSNALVMVPSWAVVRSRDVSASMEPYGVLWSPWAVESKPNSAVEGPMNGITYAYSSGSYTRYWYAWCPMDENYESSVDGQRSDWELLMVDNDNDPQLGSGYDIIHYYLEGEWDASHSDDPTIECVANIESSNGSAANPFLTIDESNFVGTPIDISTFTAWGNVTGAVSNWIVALEDNGDSTWQVALFDQEGTLIVRGPTQDGDWLGVDCDNEPGTDDGIEIHVWADNAGTLEYTTFVWT